MADESYIAEGADACKPTYADYRFYPSFTVWIGFKGLGSRGNENGRLLAYVNGEVRGSLQFVPGNFVGPAKYEGQFLDNGFGDVTGSLTGWNLCQGVANDHCISVFSKMSLPKVLHLSNAICHAFSAGSRQRVCQIHILPQGRRQRCDLK